MVSKNEADTPHEARRADGPPPCKIAGHADDPMAVSDAKLRLCTVQRS